MLTDFIDDPDEAKKHLSYINHTQPVERGIKDLTFVASRHPPEDRDAVIKLNHANRIKMPSYRNRGQYKVFDAGIPQFEDEAMDFEEEESESENEDDPYISDDGLVTDTESEDEAH